MKRIMEEYGLGMVLALIGVSFTGAILTFLNTITTL